MPHCAPDMPKIFGLVVLLNLFAAFILGHVLAAYDRPDLVTSMIVGGGFGLVWNGLLFRTGRQLLPRNSQPTCNFALVGAVFLIGAAMLGHGFARIGGETLVAKSCSISSSRAASPSASSFLPSG
jgi:hypothetical protein